MRLTCSLVLTYPYSVKALSFIPLHELFVPSVRRSFCRGVFRQNCEMGWKLLWLLQTWNMNEKPIVTWVPLTPMNWMYSSITSWVPARCSALWQVQDIHWWTIQIWFLICIFLVKVEIGLTILENRVAYLLKLNICIPDGPTITALRVYTTEMHTCVHQKTCFLWTYIYSSIIWNSSK